MINGGRKQQSARPAAEWLRLDAPALRIVTEDSWETAHRRISAARESYVRWAHGKLWGRRAAGVESKYLLTGLATCVSCGGTFYAQRRSHGSRRAHFYACSSYFYRGAAVCGDGLVLPMAQADDGVLTPSRTSSSIPR